MMEKLEKRIVKELLNLREAWKDEPKLGDWSNGYKKGVTSALAMVLEWIKEEKECTHG